MTPLTVGSLFSGIGGLELGLERAGMQVKWQVERDEYAQKVLRKNWPSATIYSDVREVRGNAVEPVDVLCGGFPCQDISNAGRRDGIDGERSGLWAEFHRLIRELRPRYVIVENVAALLVRGIERVLGDLASSGFDAEWDCVPAAAVGAPHRRDRVFLVAYPNRDSLRPPTEPQFGGGSPAVAKQHGPQRLVADSDGQRLPQRSEPHGQPEQPEFEASQRDDFGGRDAALADTNGSGLERRVLDWQRARQWLVGSRMRALEGIWSAEPDVGRVAHGVPARVDRLRCLGNAVVPQVAELIGRLIVAHAQEPA